MGYLTVKEVAAILKVSEQTVRKWGAIGEIPGERVGRRIRISKQRLEERLSPDHPANASAPTPLHIAGPMTMDLRTINETARILKVSPLTLRRYIARHTLHAVHMGRSPFKGRPTFEDGPMWSILGIGSSGEETDIANHKDEDVADAVEGRRH